MTCYSCKLIVIASMLAVGTAYFCGEAGEKTCTPQHCPKKYAVPTASMDEMMISLQL